MDPNTAGEMATLSFASVSGQQYSISVTGENDSSASFFNFLIDKGNGTFVSLASNVNFGSGFNTITLPSFIDLGTSDLVRGTAEARFRASQFPASRYRRRLGFLLLASAGYFFSAGDGNGRQS